MSAAWTERPDLDAIADMWAAVRNSEVDVGSATSVVVHDLDLQRRRFDELRAAFPDSALHGIAVKANPLVEVLRPFVVDGAGCEVASLEELHIALLAGCEPRRIVFDSPAKTNEELRFALERNVTINVDNLDELDRIDALALDSRSAIGVRINPAVGDGTIQATSVGGRGSRFGIPADALLAHLAVRSEGVPVTGLHAHVGSQGCTLEQLVGGALELQRVRAAVDALHGTQSIEFVDVGGGLPTDYGIDAAAPTIGDYAEALRIAVPELFDGNVHLITEFGRSLLAGCGVALSRVEYVKHVDGDDVVVIHLGADFLLRAAYQPDSWPYRFSLLDADGRPKRDAAQRCTVAGPLCFAGDVIGSDVPLGDVDVGDWIIIHDVGAYTYSMWSRHCSRGMPPIVGVDGRQCRLLRAAERAEDVARSWTTAAWRR
ncbi:MAG: diaminopimelate decarboxylase [Actinomycetota bacterium]